MSQTKTEDMSKEDREDNESLSDTGDVALHDEKPNQIKDEEQEAEEQPAAKRRREQRESQIKTEVKKEVMEMMDMKDKARGDFLIVKHGMGYVYTEEDEVYKVMLNQTNIEKNCNYFYEIQLLDYIVSKVYRVWTRWGDVGSGGLFQAIYSGGDLKEAKNVFKKTFLVETGNEWEERRNFVKKDGKYDMVLIDHTTDEKPSKLDKRIQSLLKLICDPEALEEIKFDIKKAPLGKLTSKQIDAGYEALKSIEECLNGDDQSEDELVEASNRFYTRIPHDFRFKIPPIIKIITKDELKEKHALLEFLKALIDEHPLDKEYRSLQCALQPLDSSRDEYQMIEKYLRTTQDSTDNEYTMTVVDIFSVKRKWEISNFLPDINNRTLLWHGSHLSNWVYILSKSLQLPQPAAPITGSYFGEGVYFSDKSSESAKDCYPDKKNPEGLLLLCEVALGDCNKVLDDDPNARNRPAGADPDKSVPLDGCSRLCNEYVVYNHFRVRMRYLLRIRFNYS